LHEHEAAIDWSVYGPAAIQTHDFVLLAVSPAYRQRWEGTDSPSAGAGAAREINALKGMFDNDREEFGRRVKVVLLPGVERDAIPLELASASQRYVVRSIDGAAVTGLIRTLSGQPRWEPNAIGAVPELPVFTYSGHDTPSASAAALRARRELLVSRLKELSLTHDLSQNMAFPWNRANAGAMAELRDIDKALKALEEAADTVEGD
jgi:hypothetical protein